MLSVLLQGPGRGGGGGGGAYAHYNASDAFKCDRIHITPLSTVFGLVGATLAVPLVYLAIIKLNQVCKQRAVELTDQQRRATEQMDHHRRRVRHNPTLRAVERSSLYLSTDGQAARTLTVRTATACYGHHIRNSKAAFNLHIDSRDGLRSVTANSVTEWGGFDICGSLVLDSPTHRYIAFTKFFANYSVHAGEFNSELLPLVVRGSWYTEAGMGDGGPFTMTFKQPLIIVDTEAQLALPEVVVDNNGAACGGQIPQSPPPPYNGDSC